MPLKAERTPLLKIREWHEAGQGAPSHARRGAYQDAVKAAVRKDTQRLGWEMRTVERQARVRGLYLAWARLLAQSGDPADQG